MSVRRLAPKEVQPESFAFTADNLDWAEKTGREGKYPWFARVHKTQRDFDVLWKGAERWRTVKIKE